MKEKIKEIREDLRSIRNTISNICLLTSVTIIVVWLHFKNK